MLNSGDTADVARQYAHTLRQSASAPGPALLISLTIKGCVRVSVCHVLSCPLIISDLNTPSQGSDTDINI